MPNANLSHKDKHTLGRIFQHPVSHNLELQDVINLISHLGTVTDANGHLTFTVNGESIAFFRSHGKDVADTQQVLDLRHFLEHARIGSNDKGEVQSHPEFTLVVINQKEALVFHSNESNTEPKRIHPDDPHGEIHKDNKSEGRDMGAHEPGNLRYYAAVANSLDGNDEIILMSNGTGASCAMTHFADFLAAKHPAIVKRITGTLKRDIESMVHGQMLQESQDFITSQNAQTAS